MFQGWFRTTLGSEWEKVEKLGGRRGADSVRTTKVDAAEMVSKQGNENMIGIKCIEINKTNEVKNVSQGNKKFKCFMVNARSLSSISKRDELELYIKQIS